MRNNYNNFLQFPCAQNLVFCKSLKAYLAGLVYLNFKGLLSDTVCRTSVIGKSLLISPKSLQSAHDLTSKKNTYLDCNSILHACLFD